MTGWASWTTVNVFSGTGGVRTVELGVMTGDVSVHTTWTGTEAVVAVQYSGGSEWYTMAGSPVPCRSEEESRALHQAAVDAVRQGGSGGAVLTLPRHHHHFG
ncbi:MULTISPECIES: hypothetical protein [Streptomyces]|uniref:Uncharacterized protein n=2 Tax=Streptomyces TaxID=1883 RepID=A0A1D8G3J4_9ACTN|nr:MULTISPECIES: hypothetical protein [Streptomyces]AOT60022.1 hypothetical protein A4G23_02885 [Streptomyces rubrolavendulae]KAF0651977.1 hypothetical protein K701_00990 [Streptomyces fradiae ATCC 10745 = DSM 40063]OSY50703.1 hypothetical protein BG846_03654 [Streptomyces fradiae ATCC 10745 = DSM 40063]QEV13181.1 hypothetical protein CP974_15610 [Streptomyces fradiae ATCC 10745 = DSM 40063]UQS31560.1 hypothetical protein J5J01_07975 [Streptomyces fradiae]